jgi:VIT1/CCC1 family predicted Fe2+/Mn2+ transporter
MRLILVLCLFALTGCQTAPDTQGTGTPTAELGTLGTQLDKSDQRVAASIAVASENADKPGVVKAELGVASSYLPKPDQTHLDYVRNRVSRNNPEEYKRAEEAGRKLLSVIDANWNKAEQESKANKMALDNANKQILTLKAEVERVRTEGTNNAFMVAAGACFLASLSMALLGQYLRSLSALIIGGAIGALPFLFATSYFVPVVTGTVVLLCVALGVYGWMQFRKPPCPDEQKEEQIT